MGTAQRLPLATQLLQQPQQMIYVPYGRRSQEGALRTETLYLTKAQEVSGIGLSLLAHDNLHPIHIISQDWGTGSLAK